MRGYAAIAVETSRHRSDLRRLVQLAPALDRSGNELGPFCPADAGPKMRGRYSALPREYA
jgi:hypothetical protein